MSGALAADDVACRRGGRLVFANVSFALGAGDALVVAGPNGCGKSSLLRLMAGLAAPFAGAVTRKGATALLGEASALDGELRLGDALSFWARLDDRATVTSRVAAALGDVGLAALSDVPVRMLSTGQRRRAALARVIAGDAAIWLLDEPASGLDAASIALLETVIARHRAAGGIAVVATHQPIALPGTAAIDLAAHQAAAA
ncbi:heme ABC exporter ATP-binding protein CcmA [Sphingomonas sp. NBWT7]|uniref:heme ABC exporter ATP-binding protein CcmA n=1 Tax=Sphingomonas sp. NBWT7 TaxID=2596913 RepID=UPI001624018A|nr:heme ABC exporter ATP-binding protein CcmA [Sphingomonas sp. NBWT7]